MTTPNLPPDEQSSPLVLPSDPVNGAKYIAAMARELQAVATRSELGLIAYFLDMIVHEADLVIRGESSGKQ